MTGVVKPPTAAEIRQTLDRARAMAGREDTEAFTLEAPRLLAQLVEALDLYVGHEPTVAEEAAYVAAEQERMAGIEQRARGLLEELEQGLTPDVVSRHQMLRRVRNILSDPEATP